MSSNSEFLDRYSLLSDDQVNRINSSCKRIKSANKRTTTTKANPKLPDYGSLGYSRVGSDGVRI